MCNFVSYFVCVILCIFVFLCDILLPSGVINDDDDDDKRSPMPNFTFIGATCRPHRGEKPILDHY